MLPFDEWADNSDAMDPELAQRVAVCANVYMAPDGKGRCMGFLKSPKGADAEARSWISAGWRPAYRINYRLRSA